VVALGNIYGYFVLKLLAKTITSREMKLNPHVKANNMRNLGILRFVTQANTSAYDNVSETMKAPQYSFIFMVLSPLPGH